MADIIRTILIMSLTGSVLAVFLFALKPLVKNRLPKFVQYYLWLVVIAALLVPVSRLLVLPTNQSPVIPNITETVTRLVVTQAEETVRLESLTPLTVVSSPMYQQERPAAQTVQNSINLVTITTYFMMIYPFGVLILLLYYAIHYAIFVGLYRRRNRPVGDSEKTMLTSMCTGRPPRLYYNRLVETPLLFGVFRPTIILPQRDYTHDELKLIISHELVHLRRKDVLVKWLVLIATALHWFNPLVWLARREVDRVCELSCDEIILFSLDVSGKQHYGNTLISVAANPRAQRAIASATMSEDKKNLKERLGAIMKSRRPARYVIILSALLIAAAIGLAALLGSGVGDGQVATIVMGYDSDETQDVEAEPLVYYEEESAAYDEYESIAEDEPDDYIVDEFVIEENSIDNTVYVTDTFIRGDYHFELHTLEPGEVVLVGILDLEIGDVFRLTITGGGAGVFTGVTNRHIITSASGTTWKPYIGGMGINTGSIARDFVGQGFRYLYVGRHNVCTENELTNVSVSFEILPDVTAEDLVVRRPQHLAPIAINEVVWQVWEEALHDFDFQLERVDGEISGFGTDGSLCVTASHGNRIVRILVQFDELNITSYHFNGINGTSTRDCVIAIFYDLPYMIDQGIQETSVGAVKSYFFWPDLGDSTVRFFFDADERVVAIEYSICDR